MNKTQPENLEQLIRLCGEDWLIDAHEPKDQAVSHLRRALAAASDEAKSRDLEFGLGESELLGEYKDHEAQVRAFLQALGATQEPAMLVMVSRILQGMTISRVAMEYEDKESFSLRVVLTSPYGEGSEEYASSNIYDAALLRHFGIMKMDGKPVFDGFYALRLG
jgi:hypothetical protein